MGPGRCFARADGRHTDATQMRAGNYSLLTCAGIVASATGHGQAAIGSLGDARLKYEVLDTQDAS